MTRSTMFFVTFLLMLAVGLTLFLFTVEAASVTLFLSLVPLGLCLASEGDESLDLFAPEVMFPVAYVVFLTLGGINLPIETEFGLKISSGIWWLYGFGLIAYLLGVFIVKRMQEDQPPRPADISFWSMDRFPTALAVVLAIGVGSKLYGIFRYGVPFFHADFAQLRVVSAKGFAGVLALCMEAGFVCVVAYLAIKKPQSTGRWLAISVLIFILLLQATSTNRTSLLRIAIPSLVVYHYARHRLSVTKMMVIGLLAFIFAAGLGTFRDTSEQGEAHVQALESQGFDSRTYWLMNGYELVRLPAEDLQMVMVTVPTFHSYTYGATSLSALAQVLPGHNPGPSERLKGDILRMNFIGFGAACTILGALWVDGGYVGIFVGMFLLGATARYLYSMMMRRSVLWLLIYSWFLQIQLKAIKDDILSDLGQVFVITVVIAIHVLCTMEWDRYQIGQSQS